LRGPLRFARADPTFAEAAGPRRIDDRGDTVTAEPLAREALGFAYRTDFLGVHADMHETLAHVLGSRPARRCAQRVEMGA
jgi:hypothetical protein